MPKQLCNADVMVWLTHPFHLVRAACHPIPTQPMHWHQPVHSNMRSAKVPQLGLYPAQRQHERFHVPTRL